MATPEELQAEREKLKQARTVIDSQAYTAEDWRHHCRMEPVRPVRIAAGLVEVRVRDTGEVIELLSDAAYDQVLEGCLG